MTYRDDRESLAASLAETASERDEAQKALQALRKETRWIRVRDDARAVGRAVAFVGAAAFGIAFAIGLIGAIVRSCEAALPSDVHGIVTDRYHHDAYITQQCTTVGRSMTCTPVYHPERWEVRVAHDGHERLDEVSESEWNSIAPGDER